MEVFKNSDGDSVLVDGNGKSVFIESSSGASIADLLVQVVAAINDQLVPPNSVVGHQKCINFSEYNTWCGSHPTFKVIRVSYIGSEGLAVDYIT